MSINPEIFFQILKKQKIDFFTGVPDSLLKQFCLCLDDNIPKDRHIITANEGNAIALAAGYHLATGKTPMVYMQNSGLGNAVNPLLSLCDAGVYSIPLIVMIGWRGEPGLKDEPQHVKQGESQLSLLEAMGIPYEVISKNDDQFENKIIKATEKAKKSSAPFVLLIKKRTFKDYNTLNTKPNDLILGREAALEIILDSLDESSIIVSTTGKTSREIFEIREKRRKSHQQDFLTVGSMGHCSSIALGIAIAKPERKIICLDGDGSLIMHMGSLATVGKLSPHNFYHILLNNFVHESVGGQETSAKYIDIPSLVKSNGYKNIYSCKDEENLVSKMNLLIKESGPNFLEVKVKPGSRKNLGRPTINPKENKKDFMNFVKKLSKVCIIIQ